MVGGKDKFATHREEKRDCCEQNQVVQVRIECQKSCDEESKPRKDQQASKDDPTTPLRITLRALTVLSRVG